LYRYDPEPRDYLGGYHDFNAILLIAIVGLSITPIGILISMAEGTFFRDTSGVFLNPRANLSLTIYAIVERLINLVLLVLAVLSFLLAWNRRTSAPLFVTIFYAANVVGTALIILAGRIFFEIYPEPTAMKNLVLAIVLAAAFIPYFRLSQRAKGTFKSRLRF
jgi:small-conductance mechanosensitive channel